MTRSGRQRLARLARLNGATVTGAVREEFIRSSAEELLGSPPIQPRTAAKIVLRWNARHCVPPLDREAVLALFEQVVGDRSAA
jgi:hypothetical protein